MSNHYELAVRKSVPKHGSVLRDYIIGGIVVSIFIMFIDWRFVFVVAGFFILISILAYIAFKNAASDRNPIILINEKGVWLTTVKEFIPWADIRDMRFVHHTKSGWFIAIGVANKELFKDHSGVSQKTKEAIANGQDLFLSLHHLDTERGDIKRAVDQWRPGLLEV